MSDAKDLHRLAMRCAEAKQWENAAALELRAAESASEPTRAVLYRSAAWLALDAGCVEDALRCAECGLSGEPPERVRRELEDVRAEAQRRMEMTR